jgi:hypothetical protein
MPESEEAQPMRYADRCRARAFLLCLSCLAGAAIIAGCVADRHAMVNRPYHAMALRDRGDLTRLYPAPEPLPGRELASGTLGEFRYGDHESRVTYQMNERTYVLGMDILSRKLGPNDWRLEELHCRVIDGDGAPLAFHGITARSWKRSRPASIRSRIIPHTVDFVFLSEGRSLAGGRVVIATAEREWTFQCE